MTFNEQSLRQAIANMWGEHGGHIDVFDMMLQRLVAAEATLDDMLDKVDRADTDEEPIRVDLTTQAPESLGLWLEPDIKLLARWVRLTKGMRLCPPSR